MRALVALLVTTDDDRLVTTAKRWAQENVAFIDPKKKFSEIAARLSAQDLLKTKSEMHKDYLKR